jgi:hypothetical protein
MDIPVDEVKPVFAQIKSGEDGTPAWLVLSLDPENKKRVVLSAVGRCALKHTARALSPDAIQFGVFRCFAHGSGIKQAKFIFFVWKGPSAPLKAKMAGQNARAPLQAFFDGCVDMEINGFEELDEAVAQEELVEARLPDPPGVAATRHVADDEEEVGPPLPPKGIRREERR